MKPQVFSAGIGSAPASRGVLELDERMAARAEAGKVEVLAPRGMKRRG